VFDGLFSSLNHAIPWWLCVFLD